MAISKFFKVIIALLILAAIGGFFYFRNQVYFSHGEHSGTKIFKIEKGQGNGEIAANLEKEGLIAGKIYFYYYLRSRNLTNKIFPGEYQLSGSMAIPEIAAVITNPEEKFIKITFPEGWTAKKMAERLNINSLPGNEFLSLVSRPNAELLGKFDFFLDKPGSAALEGYLFPDTYFFPPDYNGEKILIKILTNFNNRLNDGLREEIGKQGKSIYEILTMASIIEGEVKTEADRKIVSGIFWNRIKNGQALQSCATLAYILGVNKKQYSFEDTRTDSPYNTYLIKGLPPGPISNPGLVSIKAAIYPTQSDYNYFLSDPETGNTIFSRTIEEHNANKVKYGL